MGRGPKGDVDRSLNRPGIFGDLDVPRVVRTHRGDSVPAMRPITREL